MDGSYPAPMKRTICVQDNYNDKTKKHFKDTLDKERSEQDHLNLQTKNKHLSIVCLY